MNKELIFLLFSLAFVCVAIVSLLTAPIINNKNSEISKWGKLNCKFFYDLEENTNHIDEVQKFRKLKSLCYRQKAMYNLEYSSLIIDIVLGLLTTQLSLLLYFKIGSSIEKISGIFGIIAGIICFILTTVYVCYSGYIFNNDIAYKFLNPQDSANGYINILPDAKKLYSNGATVKWTGASKDKKVFPYEGEMDDDIEYIKYKDLGETQYNYNKRYYEAYERLTNCKEDPATTTKNTNLCDYFYSSPVKTVTNKYLYDNWITSLVFICLIVYLV